jgi:hypothetical protein
MRQLKVWGVLGIWSFICLGGGIYASWQGYGGRAFAATLSAFALLLLVMLLFTAKGVAENLARSMGPTAGFLLGACLFLTYIAYLLGTGTFAIARAGVMAGLVFVPLGLATSAAEAAAALRIGCGPTLEDASPMSSRCWRQWAWRWQHLFWFGE